MKIASVMQILVLETEPEQKKEKIPQRLSCPVPMINLLDYLSILEFVIFSILALNGVFQK